MKKIFVTTSWDDGSDKDLKLAGLLRKYGLPATFYIAKDYRKDRLSETQIRDLAKDFEMGAHTLSHPNLDLVDGARAKIEIEESKKWLEGVIQKKALMFAYPRGRYNALVRSLTENAGFIGARTVEEFQYNFPEDHFAIPTSLRVAPYPWRKKNGGELSYSGGLFGFQPRRYMKSLSLHLNPASYLGFGNLAKGFFRKVLNSGGVFHLWGHSWEIDSVDMWNELEELFKYLSGRTDVEYVTNEELVKKTQ